MRSLRSAPRGAASQGTRRSTRLSDVASSPAHMLRRSCRSPPRTHPICFAPSTRIRQRNTETLLAQHHERIEFYALAEYPASSAPGPTVFHRPPRSPTRRRQRPLGGDLERVLGTQGTTAIREHVSLSINARRPRTEGPAAQRPDPGN